MTVTQFKREDRLAAIFALGLATVLGGMAIRRYSSWHAGYFDLGIYFNHLSAIAGGHWDRAFSGHFHPILLPLALPFTILPADMAARVLLALQAVALALPIPALRRAFGWSAAIAYALHFAVWYNGLFEYHPDHLAIPLAVWFLLAVRAGRFGEALVPALLTALIKEPFALQTAACGIYLLTLRQWRLGFLLVAAGSAYFMGAWAVLSASQWAWHAADPSVLAPNLSIPAYAAAYSRLGNSPGQMLFSLIFHPLDWIGDILRERPKILYLAFLFGSFGFLPLLRPRPLLLAVPPLALSLLSSNPHYYHWEYHYTAGVVGPLAVAFGEGLDLLRRLRLRISPTLLGATVAAGALIAHVVLAPSPLGQVFRRSDMWTFNATAYGRGEHEDRLDRLIEEFVPDNPDIAVSSQSMVTGSRLFRRTYLIPFPAGVFEPYRRPVFDHGRWRSDTVMADIVVLDLKRPWSSDDQVCQWKVTTCEDGEVSKWFLLTQERLRTEMDVLCDQDGIMIFQRRRS